eukprot:COSAG03_NODE_1029_length_4991_cov_62.803557_9_plen_123_part_00
MELCTEMGGEAPHDTTQGDWGSSPADSWQIMSDGDLPADAALRRSTTSGVARRSLALLADNAAMGGGIGAAGVGIQEARWTREERSKHPSDSSLTPTRRSCCVWCLSYGHTAPDVICPARTQ